jgi:4-amino-4-deoxy-L-arabinose transferase-like glycosyltransferase
MAYPMSSFGRRMTETARNVLRIDLSRKAIDRWLYSVPILQAFTSLVRIRIPLWVWMLLVWFLLVVPAISLRSFHFEEGTVVALARGALEDGNWLIPSHYGYRFVERPALMSWLVAGLGEIFGINHWTVRAPTVLSLLVGGTLVFYLVRQRASALAALFGALCFFVSPGILTKVITAEPDLMLSVLLFAAFVIWWNGQTAGQLTVVRWVSIGTLLAATAMSKGPQPIAYFTLGVGAFMALYRRWSDVPGFLLANSMAGAVVVAWYVAVYQPGDLVTWTRHSRIGFNGFYFAPVEWAKDVADLVMRIGLEWLPALLIVVPCAIGVFRAGLKKGDPVIVALLLYALCTTAVLVVWPHARDRYAMPAVLAIAAIAGLLFDRYRSEWPKLVNAALFVAASLAIYQIVLSWLVMPLMPDMFRKSQIAGRTVAAAIAAQPATLYATHLDPIHGWDLNNNVLAYIPSRVRDIPAESLASVPTPAWVLVPAEKVAQVRALRPDLQITLRAILHEDRLSHLIELRQK